MPDNGFTPEDPDAVRLASSFEDLNVRIARLAIALDFQLEPTEHVHHRIETHLGACGDAGARRRWQELRGLLVLRSELETSAVAHLGYAATRDLLTRAERHMARDGFEPGADGLDFDGAPGREP